MLNNNFWQIARHVWLLAAMGGFCVIGTYVGVAESQERVSPAQFSTKLQSNDRQLTSIEAAFAKTEAAKTTAEQEKNSDDLSNRLAAYAKSMLDSFDTAMKQADQANKSQGKQGSMELLKSFEDLAVKHEERLKQLEGRAQKLLPKSGYIPELLEGGKVAFGWRMLEKIGDFFISPAQALIAAQVYTACHRSPPNQTACAQAIVTGNAQRVAAQATFNACWNNAHKPFQGAKRALCVPALIARLA